ncbi:MAG: uroporphyrinogen decarboxylase family protein, partial [Candidatus Hydrogenedentales bacterium]
MITPGPFLNDLFLRAARGERTPRPPIWLMRQAGRTDPAYNALREEVGLPLEDLFRHPELAARISLLPQRIGVDAIIYFQDILTPLGPMGAPFVFRPGPVTERPVRSAAEVSRLRRYDVAQELPFIPETFRLVYQELGGELPVLGFAGAPLTLLVFLAEGRSFGNSAKHAMAFLREDAATAHELLALLTDITIDYLRLQIGAGAVAVQLFESAAHLLTPALYREFALPYQQRIFDAIEHDGAFTIMFAREWEDIDLLNASGADILSLHSRISISDARGRVGKGRVIQGNLDNRLLCEGSWEDIERAALACIQSGERRGHIF